MSDKEGGCYGVYSEDFGAPEKGANGGISSSQSLDTEQNWAEEMVRQLDMLRGDLPYPESSHDDTSSGKSGQ